MDILPYTFLILTIVFFATLVRSIFGFADALIAMPLLAIIVGMKIATPLVAMLFCTVALIILIGSWHSIQFKSAWRLIVSSLLGIPLGLLLLKGLHEGFMKLVLAVILIGFSIYNLVKPHLLQLKDEKFSYIFGFVAGVLGGAYNTSGPPVVIYGALRRWSPVSFRATLQGYFFPTSLIIVISHGLGGLWTRSVVQLYALSLPLVLVAIWIGGRLNATIPQGKFDKYIYILLMAIGVFLLVFAVREVFL
ncbi:MAG: sulfite exporter TauE/SafE family protein [Planctomycetota bacterium]|jgi:uncharacterized membrane protein YfcA